MKNVDMKSRLLLAALFLPVAVAPAYGETPIRVLILSGQNNHNWQETTPALAKILTTSGRFTVEVTEHPEQCTAETFSKCDVVLSNWNSLGPVKDWPETTHKALLDFVRSGGGFVVVHAGGTMFLDRPDFQKLIGATWGPGTGHGPKHTFEVRLLDADHPITKGVQPFATTDELWHRMVAQPEKKILATAFSAKDKGGSGNDETVAMVTQFGRGRCFNLVLGHDTAAMENNGFKTLLLRGTEWAATGRVTLPASADAIRPDAETLLAAIASYQFGQSRAGLRDVENLVAAVSADPSARGPLAAKLAAMLDRDATVECKQFVCQQLSLIGFPAEVPALTRHLTDDDLAFAARFALERIPGEESLAALREALKTASGRIRVGLIDSLGARRDAKSVATVAGLISATDSETATAAVAALGSIGGREAVAAITAAESTVASALRPKCAEALLRCAEDLKRNGQGQEALPLLEKLSTANQPRAVRAAALLARVALLEDKGSELALSALEGDDPAMQAAAVQALRQSADEAALAAIAQRLGALSPRQQVRVIAVLAERKVTSALPALVQAASSEDPAIRQPAIAALGTLGSASTVPVLAKLAIECNVEEGKLLVDSLCRLRGADVDAAISAALAQASPAVQRQLVQAMVIREAKGAAASLMALAESGDAEVRQEAIRGLGKLADAKEGARVVDLLDKTADRAAVEGSLVAIYRREGDPAPVVAAVATAPGPKKASLVKVLGALGGDQALEAVRAVLKSDDPAVRMAAVRALATWPDAAPLDDLVSLATTSDDATVKAVTLHGVVRLVPLAKIPPDQLAQRVVPMVAATTKADELKLLLSALGRIRSPSSLKAALGCLQNPAVKAEAVLAATQIAEGIGTRRNPEVAAAIDRIKAASGDPAIAARLEAIPLRRNIARTAVATNLDGLHPDGAGGDPEAAIDGDPKTYWDEEDGAKLYWLKLAFAQPETIASMRILAYTPASYVPRDFEILCDGKLVKTVRNAEYPDGSLALKLPPTRCSTVELKITGYTAGSPAIRELELYGEDGGDQ